MQKYNFLYTSDKNYFPHMLTSIYSLVVNHLNDNVVIHIIESGFEKENYDLLKICFRDYLNVEIKIYSIDKINYFLKRCSIPKWRGTDIANARLFALEIIQDVEKILYIDSDTVINQSLIDAFNKENNSPVSAVFEFNVPSHLKPYLNKYYNSGVLLFNQKSWEEYNCLNLLYDEINKKDVQLVFPDQDLLNLSFKEYISPLPIDYNITPSLYNIMQHPFLAKNKFDSDNYYYSFEELKKAAKNPRIFHLLGGVVYGRPWENNTYNPFDSIYSDYRNLWDSNFIVDRDIYNTNKVKSIGYLNTLVTTTIPNDVSLMMKEKIRKIIYK